MTYHEFIQRTNNFFVPEPLTIKAETACVPVNPTVEVVAATPTDDNLFSIFNYFLNPVFYSDSALYICECATKTIKIVSQNQSFLYIGAGFIFGCVTVLAIQNNTATINIPWEEVTNAPFSFIVVDRQHTWLQIRYDSINAVGEIWIKQGCLMDFTHIEDIMAMYTFYEKWHDTIQLMFK